jgi:hypothetical protein
MLGAAALGSVIAASLHLVHDGMNFKYKLCWGAAGTGWVLEASQSSIHCDLNTCKLECHAGGSGLGWILEASHVPVHCSMNTCKKPSWGGAGTGWVREASQGLSIVN